MMDFDTFYTSLPTLNLPIKIHPSSGYLRFFSDVVLVSSYHSYNEKTTQLLPYHSYYEGRIPLGKIEPPFLEVHLKKIQNHKDPPIEQHYPKQFQTSSVMNFATYHIKNV